MSDFLQSGLHPDADMLNAFAEHVLPPHEQQEMLAHMALCSECRAVVSAALPALDEIIHPRINPVRKPWFSGWNLAWPTAVALTATLLIVVHVRQSAHTRGAEDKQSELAESHPPAPPVSPAPETTLSEKPLATSPELQRRLRRPPDTDMLADSSMQTVASAKVAAAPAKDRDEAINTSNRSADSFQSSSANVGAAALGRGVAAATAPRLETAGAIGGSALPPSLPPAASPQAAVDTAAASSATNNLAVSNPNLTALEPDANAFSPKSLKAGTLTPLPSGLPAISSSSMGQVVLALDTGNTLFYSSDNGRQWKPIASQWKDRAIRVNRADDTGPSALHGVALAMRRSSSAPDSMELKAKPSVVSQGSSLTGIVTDATGASIPNASVAVSDATKQTVQTAKSDAVGNYRINGLASGSYRIEAVAPGFQKLEQPVTLATGQRDVANLTLQVGSASETVSVTAEGQSIATSPPLTKKAAPTPAKPAPLFEITTDTGDHWTSLDGQIWTHK